MSISSTQSSTQYKHSQSCNHTQSYSYPRKRMMTLVVITMMMIVVMLSMISFVEATKQKDFYQILGVKRSASSDEIRRVYKSLALQLHPDKNPDPAAQERMMEVSEAYDTLGDEQKRRAYDAGFSDHQQYQRHRQQQQYNPWGSWGRRPDFFEGADMAASVSRHINAHNYHHLVEEDPQNVWLIEIYSTHCSGCQVIAAVWEELAQSTKDIIRVGRIHYDEDPSFAQKFRLQEVPAIYAVYRGSKHFMPLSKHDLQDLTVSQLTEFASQFFDTQPQQISVNQLENFLSASSDKVKICLVSAKKSPLLALRSLAHQYKDKISFAYATSSSASTLEYLQKKYNSASLPVLIIQKDAGSDPIVQSLSDRVLSDKSSLNSIVSNHALLTMPKLNAEFFFSTCFGSNRPKCVIAITDDPASISKKLFTGISRVLPSGIHLGWVSASEQSEFASFFTKRKHAFVMIQAHTSRFKIYQGAMEGESIWSFIADEPHADGWSSHGYIPLLNDEPASLRQAFSSIFPSFSFFKFPVDVSSIMSSLQVATPLFIMVVFMILPTLLRNMQ